MKKTIVALVLLVALLEAKVYGKLARYQPAPVEAHITEPTETPPPLPQDIAPLCALDWSLDFTPDNGRALLSCHKARKAAGVVELFCAPAGSAWEQFTNNSECWLRNHGADNTPMPTPTIDWPPTEVTPTPPAYP